ncbi:hypothetical protein M2167_002380 [Streptomyces sp. SPB4]|nr:hypothetical protein [Streptomyces sp. SPB4]
MSNGGMSSASKNTGVYLCRARVATRTTRAKAVTNRCGQTGPDAAAQASTAVVFGVIQARMPTGNEVTPPGNAERARQG